MQLVDNAVNFIYYPEDGDLTMTATGTGTNGNPLMVTTLEMLSEGRFNPDGTCELSRLEPSTSRLRIRCSYCERELTRSPRLASEP